MGGYSRSVTCCAEALLVEKCQKTKLSEEEAHIGSNSEINRACLRSRDTRGACFMSERGKKQRMECMYANKVKPVQSLHVYELTQTPFKCEIMSTEPFSSPESEETLPLCPGMVNRLYSLFPHGDASQVSFIPQ